MIPTPTFLPKRVCDGHDNDGKAKRQRLAAGSPSEVQEAAVADERLPEEIVPNNVESRVSDTEEGKSLSKSQQKKLRRRQQWEEGRDSRKAKRKQKLMEKKERKRTQHAEAGAEAKISQKKPQHSRRPVQVPITFVIDCQFEEYMTETELISMQGQLTRCYSDNRRATYRAHLCISSFGGKLKERFEGLMANMHQNWQGVRFLEQDCLEAGTLAREWMKSGGRARIEGALGRHSKKSSYVDDAEGERYNSEATSNDLEQKGEVIYLTSDSPNTLEELLPYSTYIIGGIVDKNRHKGLCYKIAQERGIKTAKLPIGDYLKMQSRTVLTTNHVSEIMLKWLEMGDWGEAFMAVIPKRKEASLKDKDMVAPTAQGADP